MSLRATRPSPRPDDTSVMEIVTEASGARRSMTAAAQVLSGKRPNRRDLPQNVAAWQSEVWGLLDEIGELWFAGSWMSAAQSRMRLVAAKVGDDGEQPRPLDGWATAEDENPTITPDDRIASRLVARLAGGPSGQSQIMARAGWHLTIAGDTYLVAGKPIAQVNPNLLTGPVPVVPAQADPLDPIDAARELTRDADDWFWTTYSDQELTYGSTGYRIDDGSGVQRTIPEDHLIIRCWRPHPRRFHEAGCATRSALPILRELRGLTMHVSAQIDSRLAGAGLLLLPQSMTFPAAAQVGDLNEGEDPFVQYLIEVMMTAIRDRDSAGALVPIVIKVPDDSIGKVQHLSFSQPLDQFAPALRSEALHRLSLSLDCPPEIIMGKGDTSHWNSWNIDESAVTMHVAPLTAVICHALTVGWLQPTLEKMGVENYRDYMVWYDATPLTLRPDRSTDAKELFDRTEIGGAALRRETGFSETDAPNEEERKEQLLLRIVERAPTLAPIILPLLGINIPKADADQAKDTALAISGIDPETGAQPGQGAVDPIRDARQLSKEERAQIESNAQTRGRPDAGAGGSNDPNAAG